MSVPLVLCYHGVSDSWPSGLSVGPRQLEQQLRSLLRRGYRPADADRAVAGRGRLIHVTFDDAYRSVAAALPVLELLGVPATVFACASFADDGREPDVRELAYEVRSYPGELLTMDWDRLRDLAERGVEIGSHTFTHARLPDVPDGQLDAELRDSRERIADELRRPCRFLSYPYGEQDARVRAAAERAGYDAAFALPGKRTFADRYAIPRVGVYRADRGVRFLVKTSLNGRLVLRHERATFVWRPPVEEP